jgi:hypothetical protein
MFSSSPVCSVGVYSSGFVCLLVFVVLSQCCLLSLQPSYRLAYLLSLLLGVFLCCLLASVSAISVWARLVGGSRCGVSGFSVRKGRLASCLLIRLGCSTADLKLRSSSQLS